MRERLRATSVHAKDGDTMSGTIESIESKSALYQVRTKVPFPPDRLLWMNSVPDVWTLLDGDTIDGEPYIHPRGYSTNYNFGCRNWSRPYRYTGPAPTDNQLNGPACIDHDAWRSAVAMLKEHDLRIADAGALPGVVTTKSFDEIQAKLVADLEAAQTIRAALVEASNLENWDAAEALQTELEAILNRRKNLELSLYKKGVEAAREYRAKRIELFAHYYLVSQRQFERDIASMQENEPTRIEFSIDGIMPMTREALAQKDFERRALAQIENDRRVIGELIAAGRTEREIVELSRITATDPVAREFVNAQIDQVIPPVFTPPPADAPTPGGWEATALEWAPETTLDRSGTPILRNPALPPTPDNFLTAEEMRQRELRIAQRLIDDAPEYYVLEWNKSQNPAKWRQDYAYWRTNFPTAQIHPEDNEHLTPEQIATPWNSQNGPPPLINLRITPRQKPLPEQGFLAKYDWIAPVVSIVLAAIPVVGIVAATLASAMINAATANQVKSWARELGEFPPEVFAPQYFPQTFTVPMPLDRAQRLVSQPWYIANEVDRFIKEYSNDQIQVLQGQYEGVAGDRIGEGAFQDLPEEAIASLGKTIATKSPSTVTGSSGAVNGSSGGLLALAAVGGLVLVAGMMEKRKR